MLILSPRFFRLVRLILSLTFLIVPSFLLAGDLRMPEEQLSRKIVAVTGPGAIAIEFTNRSSLGKSSFDDVRRGLLTQLASMGLHFVSAEQSAAVVRFSLSQDLHDYIWIAEINQGTNAPVVTMISSPRDDRALFTPPAASVTLHKTPLWTQDITILDVTWIEGSPPHLIVLDVDKIAAYRFQDGRWQTEESWPITHANLWPRDARGKLVLGPDNLIDAYLPGLYCHTTSGKTQTLTCKATDDPWPLGPEQNGLDAFFAATRNYFTGVLAPGIAKQKATAPFYTAAIIPHQTYNLGLFAGVDGQIHVLDGSTDRNAGNWGWGSSVAGVHTDCGSGWQVLANRGSSDVNDTLTAYDLPDREPVAVSQALEFGGPVTEIWTKSGSSSAVAVVHNRETGQYEAFRLTVTCNQ